VADNPEQAFLREITQHRGIAPDSVLIVHSAFSRFGRAGFDVNRFIDALLALVPRGALLMPVMTWRLVTDDHPYFDEIETPSITGVLSEVFRVQYAESRSIHPTHSAAAAGPLAGELTSEHRLDPTPCSRRSPFGKLARYDARVLMLGAGLEACTSIHCAEELIAPELYFRPGGQIYYCRDRSGETHEVYTRRHQKLHRDFPKFEIPMRQAGALWRGEHRGAVWRLIEARALDEIVMAALERDPTATIREGASADPIGP
jgi:aminoglycoside 3-N-acetyltransferase